MALYVGDTAIRRVYHGTTPIKRIYQGSTLLWSALGTATGLSSTRNNTSFTPAWPAVDGADSYDLRWSTSSDMSNPTLVTGTTSGTAVTGLSALTTYYWQVRANEGNIEGDWSATQSVTTTGTLSGLSSTRTRTSFTPSWNAIAGLAYDMRWSTNSDMTSATTVTGTTSGTAVTGLDSSTTYYWEVRSKRGSTNGAWSSTQSVTTQAPLTAPARGAAPSATGSRGQVEWVATAPDNGGSAITSYQWRWREVGAVSWRTTVTTTGRTFTRTGLSNGTQYEAQFKAVNTIAAAASWSPSGTATTTAIGVPARGLAPSASGGNKQVRWQASAPNNGGSAITGYDWRWRQVGAASWTAVNNGGATLTRTGLAADTRYEAQFKAKNAIGSADDWSPSGTGRTNQLPVAAAPSATINSVARGDEGTTVRLTRTLNGGTYDQYLNAWSVDEGTLDDATADSPTWTRPAVSATKNVGVNYSVTVRGTGTNARSGTSASASANSVSAEVVNTVTLAGTTYTPDIQRVGTTNMALSFDDNANLMSPPVSIRGTTTYLRTVLLGTPDPLNRHGLGVVTASTASGTGSSRGPQLSDAFESGWVIRITVGQNTWTFSASDFTSDDDEPYNFWTTNATVRANLAAARDAIVAIGGGAFSTSTSGTTVFIGVPAS